MRAKALRMGGTLVLCLVIGQLLGLLSGLLVVSAFALEVPKGVQEVRVPVTLPAEEAIAGGEVEFSQTAGLEYLRFEPAGGVKNPVKATVGDKTYVGFFSSGNEFEPVGGTLPMGELVFRYTGDASEQVTLSEMKLHTKVDTGTGVDTLTLNPNTVIPVSRAGDGSGGGGDGGGNTGGTGGNSGGTGNTGGTGGNTAGGGTGNSGGTGGNTSGTAVADATGGAAGNTGGTAGGGDLSGAPDGSQAGDDGAVSIDDGVTPLASIVDEGGSLPAALLPVLLLALLAVTCLFVLLCLFRRKRRRQVVEFEEDFGRLLRDDRDDDQGDGTTWFAPDDSDDPPRPHRFK